MDTPERGSVELEVLIIGSDSGGVNNFELRCERLYHNFCHTSVSSKFYSTSITFLRICTCEQILYQQNVNHKSEQNSIITIYLYYRPHKDVYSNISSLVTVKLKTQNAAQIITEIT